MAGDKASKSAKSAKSSKKDKDGKDKDKKGEQDKKSKGGKSERTNKKSSKSARSSQAATPTREKSKSRKDPGEVSPSNIDAMSQMKSHIGEVDLGNQAATLPTYPDGAIGGG